MPFMTKMPFRLCWHMPQRIVSYICCTRGKLLKLSTFKNKNFKYGLMLLCYHRIVLKWMLNISSRFSVCIFLLFWRVRLLRNKSTISHVDYYVYFLQIWRYAWGIDVQSMYVSTLNMKKGGEREKGRQNPVKVRNQSCRRKHGWRQ